MKELERDGIETVNPEDFQTYTARIRVYHTVKRRTAQVWVPRDIVDYLKLESGDFVQVAIRKLPQEKGAEH